MTKDDDALQEAIIDEIDAQRRYAGLSMTDLAAKIERPYDSTRNYLKKERGMPLGIFIEICAALQKPQEEIIRLARLRLQK